MRIKPDQINLINPKGEVFAIYGVATSRGRELAERELKFNRDATAVFNGITIPWIKGPYNDVILDHPSLPKIARSKYRNMDDNDFYSHVIQGATYEMVKVNLILTLTLNANMKGDIL